MEFSNEFFARIIVFEGFRNTAYKCAAGVWTIGYGTTLNVKEGMKITSAQAFNLLKEDAQRLSDNINKLGVAFNQNQFDAVGLLCYNIGFSAFKRSTLFSVIKKNHNDRQIYNLWKKWVYCKGKVLQGLVDRRQSEVNLYFSI